MLDIQYFWTILQPILNKGGYLLMETANEGIYSLVGTVYDEKSKRYFILHPNIINLMEERDSYERLKRELLRQISSDIEKDVFNKKDIVFGSEFVYIKKQIELHTLLGEKINDLDTSTLFKPADEEWKKIDISEEKLKLKEILNEKKMTFSSKQKEVADCIGYSDLIAKNLDDSIIRFYWLVLIWILGEVIPNESEEIRNDIILNKIRKALSTIIPIEGEYKVYESYEEINKKIELALRNFICSDDDEGGEWEKLSNDFRDLLVCSFISDNTADNDERQGCINDYIECLEEMKKLTNVPQEKRTKAQDLLFEIYLIQALLAIIRAYSDNPVIYYNSDFTLIDDTVKNKGGDLT